MKLNKQIRIIAFGIMVLTFLILLDAQNDKLRNYTTKILGEDSFWTQTDWTGGVDTGTISSDVNTFVSQSNIDHSQAGEIKLDVDPNWSIDYGTWQNRRKITFDNTTSNLGVTSTELQNYPVLVTLEDGVNIDYSKVQDSGEDIRFTDSDGTVLDYEIDNWDETDKSSVWVNVPIIEANSNTDHIYIYYGNPIATDGQSPEGVWDDGYQAVWHNKDLNSSVVKDSTSGNDVSKGVANQPSEVDSPIGKAQSFDGLNDYLRTNNSFDSVNSGITIEGWYKEGGTGTNYEAALHKSTSSTIGSTSYWMGFDNANNITATIGANTGVGWAAGQTTTVGLLGQWYYVVASWDGSVVRVYIDGLQVKQYNLANYNIVNAPTRMGASSDGTNYQFRGDIDEIRISTVGRSSSWIAATHKSTTESYNTYGDEESKFASLGTLTSNVFDALVPSDWGSLTYTGQGIISIKIRSDSAEDLSGAPDWSSCSSITSGTDISETDCVNDLDRYVQYRVELQPDGTENSILQDITIGYRASDQVPPEVNATDIAISGLTNSGDWYASEPTITWTEGVDDLNGNGILGHCVAIDEAEPDSSNGLNPAMSSGILTGKNDGVAQDYCPYIVVGDEFEVSAVSGLDLTSGKQYYISVKAVDIAGNIYTGTDETWKDLLSFKYDNQAPTAPFYISLPANFLSSKDVVVTWPVGVGGADDLHSGLAGLQYRIGDSGTWYGDLHTGTEDINDLLINDGSYVTDETYDYPELVEGNNLIYVRAVDNLGNVTAPENYVKGLLKLNTVAPSPVRNLTVNPLNADVNAYTFTWDVPSTYTGSSAGITYCYAVNAIPSVSNCTFTDAGVTSLGPDAFATQPGENTMYVVAKDEAGNINYATYSEPGSSVTYTYSGTAPGITQNLDVADISVKATENWRLVLSWDQPTNVGAGISYYNIYRSGTTSSCNANFAAFTKVGSSTSTSYIDPNLEQKLYNYCIKACDSANNCSASSGTVGRLPTGKFTEPAELLSPPEVVSFTTRKAVINWITDRVSDSSVQFGLETGVYFEEEISNSLQIASHTITLNNLQPGTTYYYRAKWTDVDGNIGVSEEKTFATLPPPRVLEVNINEIRTDSALVTFTVNSATSVDLLYGSTLSYGGTLTTATSTTESTYTSRITNLNEDSIYNFKFILRDIEGNDYDSIENHRFTTLPTPRVQDIQVQEVKNSAQPTVDVNWTSNVPISSQVTYYPLDNVDQKRDKLDVELKTEHETSISELQPNRRYGMIITGRDAIGNQAESDEYQFTTAADSRPPAISNIKVETRVSNTSTGEQAQTQLIITWDTDEEATSQIEYGEGANGTYTQRSLVDDNLTFNHLVIVNNLRPSSVYHFRVVSADSAGNESTGKNVVTITAQVSENPLDIIISRLTEVFGFIR
jgi:hypothetical protein